MKLWRRLCPLNMEEMSDARLEKLGKFVRKTSEQNMSGNYDFFPIESIPGNKFSFFWVFLS